MPSPAPRPPSPWGSQFQPELQGGSPAPASPALPRRPAPGRLESSFSVEAILARPEARSHAASPPPGSCSAGPASSEVQWLWTGRVAWLPAYLSVCVYPLCPQPCVPELSVVHFCGCQGLRVTGWELAHYPGFWGHPVWAPTEEFQNPDRHQKRVRTMFNLQQLEELEKVFAKQHNLVGKKRAQLAARLHLTENQVRIWFQNRRVKYQKQQKLKSLASSAMSTALDEPSSSSDGSFQGEDAESGVGS